MSLPSFSRDGEEMKATLQIEVYKTLISGELFAVILFELGGNVLLLLQFAKSKSIT